MKILVHITFFYEQSELKYLEKIIQSYNNFKCEVDVQINTNKLFSSPFIKNYKNGQIKIKKLNLSFYSFLNNKNYFYTWLSYKELLKTKKIYDFYIYSEHDIELTYEGFSYYKLEKSRVGDNYNIGFIRTEVKNGKLYSVDLKDKNLKSIILNSGREYVKTNFLYSGLWILNNLDFKKFKNKKESNLEYLFIKNKRISDKLHHFSSNKYLLFLVYCYKNKMGHGIRELPAHGPNYPFTNLFDEVLITINRGEISNRSFTKHLSNKYVEGNDSGISDIKIKELLIT